MALVPTEEHIARILNIILKTFSDDDINADFNRCFAYALKQYVTSHQSPVSPGMPRSTWNRIHDYLKSSHDFKEIADAIHWDNIKGYIALVDGDYDSYYSTYSKPPKPLTYSLLKETYTFTSSSPGVIFKDKTLSDKAQLAFDKYKKKYNSADPIAWQGCYAYNQLYLDIGDEYVFICHIK